ncbi:uncharacterized protein PHALS_11383 [Plasmopara halstedii]|uniref:Uncharacterized protein n=1 Tax=Plasmopara halstedii TaxID=4781 RepID=A0A0P1A5T6_PLAHL|nr:uncharacterized protein PHALS_11383 [Plasmopara halstedii]CEG35505.1 hypothetical protein PHALS_11383 [Plasmopara halstedii]|eukprot:XP_024571874.1 hypothetical protein PHALS_11383 [Plasmopara halstedii]
MGCTSSKTQLETVLEPTHTHSSLRHQPREGWTNGGNPQTLRVEAPNPARSGQSNGNVLSAAEKRERAAEAAEARKKDWRQGGHSDPEKARSIARRREKDELLAKIYNKYTLLGREPSIGLPSCDLDQLRRHLETLC